MPTDEQQHPIVQRSVGLLERIEALERVEEAHQETVLQATAVLKQLVTQVQGANPLLLSTTSLDAISDHLSSMETAFPVLEGAETTATLADIRSSLEQVRRRLSDILVIQRPKDVDAVTRTIAEMRAFAEDQIKALNDEVGALRSRSEELDAEIKTAASAHEANVATLKTSLDEVSAAIEVNKGELQTALDSQNSLFEAEQKKRQATFTTTLDEISTAHQKAHAKLVQEGEASVQDVLKKANIILEKIEKRKGEVEEVAEAVGLTATISGFAKYADQQKNSADWWRGGAVAALLAVVALGVGTLAWVDPSDLTLQRSLLKGSVGTALAFLAGYAGKQSGHHRKEERRSRRLGLEVHAFDPYVANLDPTRQKALKEFMALRVFGHLEDPDSEEDKWGEHQPTVKQVMDVLSPSKSES